MKEIQLVGAAHGVATESFFGNWFDHEVDPPAELITGLGLASGANIAIEAVPGNELTAGMLIEADDMTPTDYLHADTIAKGQHFFGATARALTSAGYSVSGIDDRHLRLNVYPRHAALILESPTLAYLHDGMIPGRLARKIAFSKAFLGHMDTSVREERMFQKLSDGDFDSAILGRGHTDVLAADLDLQEHLGIRVTEYLRVDPLQNGYPITDTNKPNGFSSQKLSSHLYAPVHAEVEMDAHSAVVERELYRRRYNAFTVGRVLGRHEAPPDFLGRFYITGCAETSLFELHLTERSGSEFTATIYDILGTAAVEGTLTTDEIAFRKTYDKSTMMATAIAPLNYQGSINGDSGDVVGRWAPDNENINGGFCFVMTPYDRHALHRLNNNDVVYGRNPA